MIKYAEEVKSGQGTKDEKRVIEKLLMQQDVLCSQRSVCLQSKEDSSVCGGNLVQSSSLITNPFLIEIN